MCRLQPRHRYADLLDIGRGRERWRRMGPSCFSHILVLQYNILLFCDNVQIINP
jgi:hypothetical protein